MKQTDRQTDRERDRQTDRQTERQTDRQTARQRERGTPRFFLSLTKETAHLWWPYLNSLLVMSLLRSLVTLFVPTNVKTCVSSWSDNLKNLVTSAIYCLQPLVVSQVESTRLETC